MITLTDETFADHVASEPLVLVYFWATWCPPCRMMGPVIAELAAEGLPVAKADLDACPRTARDLHILGAPTLHLYRDGELVYSRLGALPKHQLLTGIRDSIPAGVLR